MWLGGGHTKSAPIKSILPVPFFASTLVKRLKCETKVLFSRGLMDDFKSFFLGFMFHTSLDGSLFGHVSGDFLSSSSVDVRSWTQNNTQISKTAKMVYNTTTKHLVNWEFGGG